MRFFFGLMYIIVGIFDIVSDMSGVLFSAVLFSHGFFYLVYRHYKSERDDRAYGRHWVLGSSEQSRAIISESIASERQNRDALHGMETSNG